MNRVLLGLIVATPATFGMAEDWTEFRGPSGQGLSIASDLPISWSETDNVTWKVKLDGVGWSSPVVGHDRIYLTTAIAKDAGKKADQSLRVLCLNATDGSEIWNVEAFVLPGDKIEMHRKNSHASPTPILDGDRLFVHFGSSGTACLNLDGSFAWKNQNLKYSPNHGNGGSPAIAGNMLVICCDGSDVQYVVGLNKQTGERVWKTDRDTSPSRGFSFCTPTIIKADGRDQAICPGSEVVFAYDPKTGEELWRVRYGDGYSVVPRPLFAHGLVYVCSGFDDQTLYAIDPTGTGDVTDTHVKWQRHKAIPRSGSPILLDDELYLVDDGGIATCVDAKTGKPHWTQRLGGKFSASPLAAAGRIYFQDEDGKATVVQAGRDFKQLSTNQVAGDGIRTFASYAVVDNAILLRSETHLYRIESK
jgi:outer membrane protein assembly factor BamB